MRDDKVLVTGATGKTGRRVVRLLEERGVPVRAASRSGTPRFDWTDPTTWDAALHDVTAVYLVHPGLDGPESTEAVITAFTRRAAATGTRRAVLLSAPGEGSPDAGLEWTVLRPRWFFQNFSEDFLRDPVMAGELRLPTGDGQEAFVDADDIAEVAVAALTEDGHHGRYYELTGPRLMTFGDAAAELAKATGRDIGYVPLTREAYVEEQLAYGIPDEWVRLSADLYESVRAGSLASLTDDVQRVLGRPPGDFADYARTAAAQGAWNS